MLEATYTVVKTSDAPAELIKDMACDKPFLIIRTSAFGREQAWSFHATESSAKAAARRWVSRAVVTR